MQTTQNRGQAGYQQHQAESMSMVGDAISYSEDCVRNNPVTSTMVAFGAGAAIGLLVAYAISQREEEKRDYFSRIGRQMSNALGHAIPESFLRK